MFLSKLHFNSIKVRLKLLYAIVRLLALPHFNSIKVRLKRNIALPALNTYFKFQFHKGTIKTFNHL